MHAYIAGPLFNEGERWFDERIDEVVRRVGLTSFVPHRDGDLTLKSRHDVLRIFKEDVENLERADLVIANLNGITTDDGTAWELGYAYARGKHLVGVYTDWRMQFEHQTVNLMIECSLNRLVRSLEALEVYLTEYVARPKA